MDERKKLMDTCFVIDLFKRHHEKIPNKLTMTSFNYEELDYILHKIDDDIRHRIKKYMHHGGFDVIKIPVSPGNRDSEVLFVDSVNKNLLKHIHDPSDAVLIAAAIKLKCDVLTRDKHHLYTANLENYLNDYGIIVTNNLDVKNQKN